MTDSTPALDALLRLADGHDDPATIDAAAAATAADRAAAAMYGSARAAARADDSEPVPAGLIARLKAIGPPAAASTGLAAAIRRGLEELGAAATAVVAELLHDSRAARPGFRGAAVDGAEFHTAWEGPNHELDLRATSHGDGTWTVSMQLDAIDGADCGDVAVRLLGLPAEAELDAAADRTGASVDARTEAGGFAEARVPSGRWAIVVVIAGEPIVVPAIDLIP